MRRPSLFLALVLLASIVLVGPRAHAHGMRTGMLRVDEATPTRALARWTTTVARATVTPVLPADCATSSLDDAAEADAHVFVLECPDGLAGRTFGARGLGPVVTEATVFVQFLDGRTASHLLTPGAPTFTVPAREGAGRVAQSYVGAGLLHIATGADHVLFLALLVLLLRRVRAVLLAETAFTVSHSLAFAATSLGWVHVRPAPVEACIALSLVLLALDVRAEPSTKAARASLMALVFGLVHGLGFAGGLRETGLPDEHAAIALAGFGAGVELGQVAILACFLACAALLARLRAFPRFVVPSSTLIGSLATAWLVERLFIAFTA